MRCFARIPLVGVLAGVLGSATNGSAADMPAPGFPPPVAPAIEYSPAPYSWTGFYIGANAGWTWSQLSESLTGTTATGAFSGTSKGFLGGAQAGFNWQVMGPLVVGVETDFQGTTERGTIQGTFGPSLVTGDPKEPYFGTVRARVGFAYDRLLFYGTAGGAYGDSALNGSLGKSAFTASTTYWTWTAGAGIEAALGGHFSAKFEYLYIGTPSSLLLVPGAASATGTGNSGVARAGVNYRF